MAQIGPAFSSLHIGSTLTSNAGCCGIHCFFGRGGFAAGVSGPDSPFTSPFTLPCGSSVATFPVQKSPGKSGDSTSSSVPSNPSYVSEKGYKHSISPSHSSAFTTAVTTWSGLVRVITDPRLTAAAFRWLLDAPVCASSHIGYSFAHIIARLRYGYRRIRQINRVYCGPDSLQYHRSESHRWRTCITQFHRRYNDVRRK